MLTLRETFLLPFPSTLTATSINLTVTAPNTSAVSYQILITPGSGITVQSLLELVYNQQYQVPPSYSFVLQFFGSPSVTPPSGAYFMGYELIMLNGTSQAATDYWHLLINGSPAQAGVDSEMVRDGDNVLFEYGFYVPERHGLTSYSALRANRLASASS